MTLSLLFNSFLSLITLLFLEIVLGIDNLVFVSIATSRLPKDEQKSAQKLGLSLALITRLLLLSIASWLASLQSTIITVGDFTLTWRNSIFILGGLFLLYKASDEIHSELQHQQAAQNNKRSVNKWKVITQIALLDIVFSFDSVITAIGMTPHFEIMALAICLAMILMIIASYPITRFINANPSVKMLAISFILMVGMVLIADGFHSHIPRGYIYFSIIFSLFVETLNIVARKRKER